MSMDTTVDSVGTPGPFGRFWRWWCTALAGLLPASLRRTFAVRPAVLRLRAESERLQRPDRPDATQPEIVAAARAGNEGLPVLEIAAGRTLVRTVTLPAAARQDPAEALELEIERQTPFRRDQVHFAFELDDDEGADTLAARLAVIPKAALAEDLAHLDAAGISPARIDIEDIGPLRDSPLPPPRGSGGDPLTRALLIIALMLGLALAAAPRLAIEKATDQAQARLATDGEIDGDALARIRRHEKRHLHLSAVLALRQNNPTAVEILEEATRVIPDDTWIAFLSLREGGLHLEGSSDKVSDLLIALESSPRFKAMDLRAPVVRDPGTGRERFRITIRLGDDPS